jgi:Tol biopolymer transport system component
MLFCKEESLVLRKINRLLKKVVFWEFKRIVFSTVLTAAFIFLVCGCDDSTGPRFGFPPVYPYLDERPTWFPDGRRIIYFHWGIDSVDRKSGGSWYNRDSMGLWIINSDGTNRRKFLGSGGGLDIDVSPDGEWILFNWIEGQIFKIDTSGNNLTQLTSGTGNKYSPRWSPDGRKILFAGNYIYGYPDSSGIHIMNSDGSGIRRVIGAFRPSWGASGDRFIAFRYNSISNVDTLSIIDTNGNVIRDIRAFPSMPDYLDWSYTNNVILVGWQHNIWTVDPATSQMTNLISDWSYDARWSPDGTKIAYLKYDGRIYDKNNGTIWIVNSDGTNRRQLTPGLR